MIPGEFVAQDEQTQATLGLGQPYRLITPLQPGPQPPFVEPITCSCTRYREVRLGVGDRQPPCVNEAGPDGLCGSCRAGLCIATKTTEEAA